jgi:hypothetical protein
LPRNGSFAKADAAGEQQFNKLRQWVKAAMQFDGERAIAVGNEMKQRQIASRFKFGYTAAAPAPRQNLRRLAKEPASAYPRLLVAPLAVLTFFQS